MAKAAKTTSSEKRRPVSAEEYSAFVAGLALQSIVLTKSSSEFMRENYTKGEGEVQAKLQVDFEVTDGGLDAVVALRVRARPRASRRFCTKVDCVYRATYACHEAPSPEVLEIFDANVRKNVWPYARELVHSLTSKMDGPTLQLPLLK